MESKLKKCCPNCSQPYHLKSSQIKGNLPLLLSCGHSMCENCIRSIVKAIEPIECKKCHRNVEIKAGDAALVDININNLYEQFPINVFMVGELTLQDIQMNHKKKSNLNEEEYYVNLQEIIKSLDSTQGQCLECHNSTGKMCQQCATVLCDTCYNKTHKNFVVFKNHILTNIEPHTDSNSCSVHEAKPLDYYCKDCKKSVCMDCMMVGGDKSCKNHDVVSMQEVNNKFYEELNQVTPKVDETFKRLTKTAIDIGNLLYNIDSDTGSACELTHLIADIDQHFSKLFAQIQKHKTEVIDIVVKVKCAERESLQKAKTDVAEAIRNAKLVLNTINFTSDPNKLKQMNLSTLLEKAKQITESPWYLCKDECETDPLKVAVNDDLCALMTDYIHLEGNIKSVYKLQSTTELGEDFVIPPAPPAPVYPPELPKDVRQTNKVNKTPNYKESIKAASGLYKNAPTYRSKCGSQSSLNSCESESSYRSYVTQCTTGSQRPIVHPVQPFEESQHPKQLFEGSQELIYITHIIDPHNFFVQRSSHQTIVKELLREFRNANSLPKPSLDHVSEGKVYLVFNKTDNMWQRCRVVSVDRRKVDQPLVHVFCIDFGSTEIVHVNKLRLIPPARLQTPFPLAINCSLANCVPRTGAWTSDDSILIQNIIDNKQAVIHIRRIVPTSNYSVKLDCDVTTLEGHINVARALVFHERAKMPNPKLPYPTIKGTIERPKIFMNNNDFKLKSVEEVSIVNTVNPDKFFVRKRHLQEVYEKLCNDLEQEYSLNINTGSIHLPEIGMVCAVDTKTPRSEGGTGTWARGVVVELPGRGRVSLMLPDTGETILVHWTAMRQLHQKFTILRGLATECYLAGVSPLNKKWNAGSVALLRKFEDRFLELTVDENRNRGALGVTLYDNADPENQICVNKEMIKYKFAVSFGMFKFNKKDVEEQVITNKSPLDPPKKNKKQPEVVVLKKQTSQKKIIKDEDLEAKDKGPLRLEAKVLHYQSPSLLYVTLVHQEKVFNELYEKIQKHYTLEESHGKEAWAVGDRCCAVCLQSQTWRRAVIVEREDANAKIFYSDFACIETIPIDNLRDLATEFASIGDAAVKCHLCGVIPAVGDEWPSITKEFLKELLDAYKRIFITKLGNFVNKSMPIEVWVYHTIQGGALEPNKSEWRCLNNKIIEQGLGIPDKSQEVSRTDNTSEDSEMLSFLNVTGSVHEWLQLEPLPTKSFKSRSDAERCTPSSDVGDDELTEDTLHNSNTVFISDWLPPEQLQNEEFTGVPTYIDNDGIIYLHDVAQQDTLDLIRKALDVRFKKPDPKAKYAKWTVGEPCIAMFFLDNRFYRGRVLEVNNETSSCIIHYVDYGNEEPCSFENLRKSLALYQIPVQAHKCVLDRIRPLENCWDRPTLDYVHKSIVEKQCLVKVKSKLDNDILSIELKFDKLWINDHLVEFEMAEYLDGSKAVVRKFAPIPASKLTATPALIESDSVPDYIVEDTDTGPMSTSQESFDLEAMREKDWNKLMEDDNQSLEDKYVTYPKFDKNEFLCNIVLIHDTKTLDLNVIHEDETNLLYEEMFNKLQVDGANMTPLDGIFEHKACVALFHEDGQWYRAEILQYCESKNQIKVRYVDYGNIEVISLADVREITDDFLVLPPSSIQAKLNGVELNNDIDVHIVSQEYANVFLDKGPFTAKVINYIDEYPIVELRNDDDDLVYESLITKGIFLN